TMNNTDQLNIITAIDTAENLYSDLVAGDATDPAIHRGFRDLFQALGAAARDTHLHMGYLDPIHPEKHQIPIWEAGRRATWTALQADQRINPLTELPF
ncbi:hypothetical protein, partial [Tsukamurella sp. 8J]